MNCCFYISVFVQIKHIFCLCARLRWQSCSCSYIFMPHLKHIGYFTYQLPTGKLHLLYVNIHCAVTVRCFCELQYSQFCPKTHKIIIFFIFSGFLSIQVSCLNFLTTAVFFIFLYRRVLQPCSSPPSRDTMTLWSSFLNLVPPLNSRQRYAAGQSDVDDRVTWVWWEMLWRYHLRLWFWFIM